MTAKLSRRFYERFGDEITNELVDWMNSVDASYQSSLRELNEINFARFDAKLEQRVAAVENRIDAVETRLSARIDAVEMGLGARIDMVETGLRGATDALGALDKRVTALHEEFVDRLAATESRTLRWIVGLWTTNIIATIGLMIAVLVRDR